MDKKNKNKSRT